MKNSIKRAQSQARLSFAERENFRPKVKQLKKTLLTLVALLALTTGAWADEVKYPIVYDFEAAANALENPSNKNSTEASGQGFYGWENAEKTDSKRQDYKGYEYAEGSKLPEVCHVWRRSDRINGNVSGNGGLKCPSNKEMAVDGLTEGLAVTIIYDATNATDKEIVWAIGDGSSEGGPGSPRATATINGAEAVPGTTTIKSGDVITVTKVTPAANGSGYIVFGVKKDMVIKKIIIDVAPTGTPVPLTRGTGDKINEWTLTNGMPAGNVTVSVEYFPQAALTEAPTAINDVPATTDGAIVKAGTVANIGSTETAQGTVMYYVSPTALDDAALLALAADQWTADVPTAESLAEGQAYVYYYVRGNDSDTDEENFSDGDILAANALTVTIAAEPTYDVTFADGVNPEPPADPEWTASPNADVKKGQTVTVTYTGTRKVIGVKAEKKAAAPAPTLAATLTTAGMTVSVSFLLHDNAETVNFTSNGDGTYTKTGGTGTTATAPDWTIQLVENNGLIVFKAHESDKGENSDEAFKFNFFPSDNTYYMWRGLQAQYDFEVTFTSISVNGTAIAVTEAQDS